MQTAATCYEPMLGRAKLVVRLRLLGLTAARLAFSRRRLQVAVPIVLVVTAGGFVASSIWIWSWPLSSGDRLAAIGDAASIAALSLAAFGVLFALLAYLGATQSPDLEAELEFIAAGDRNQPVFLVDDPDGGLGTRAVLIPDNNDPAQIRIRNQRSFAAHNPSFRIDLVGLGGLAAQEGWSIGSSPGRPFIQQWAQWEGGADLAIHGEWVRTLPPLSFKGVVVYPGVDKPLLVMGLVADSMGPRWQVIPVTIQTPATYKPYLAEKEKEKAKPEDQCEVAGCAGKAQFVILVQNPGHPVSKLHVCDKHHVLKGKQVKLRRGGMWIPIGDAVITEVGEDS